MINLRLHIGGSAYSGDISVFSAVFDQHVEGLPKCSLMWIREDRSQMSLPCDREGKIKDNSQWRV